MGKKSPKQAADSEIKHLEREIQRFQDSKKPYCLHKYHRVPFFVLWSVSIGLCVAFFLLQVYVEAWFYVAWCSMYPWIWEFIGILLEKTMNRRINTIEMDDDD
jgi:hypothetical protein